MNENRFYDIHMHAFNLNYQYLRSFLTRLDLLVIAAGALFAAGRVGIPALLLLRFFGKTLPRARNMLALMENDLGEFLLQTEYCLRRGANPRYKDGQLHIGANSYDGIVLTPLLIDFGRPRREPIGRGLTHYSPSHERPVVGQVVELFLGIQKYLDLRTDPDWLHRYYPEMAPETGGNLEIYPFMGLNTRNYPMAVIQYMLDNYFGNYRAGHSDFLHSMGGFGGDITHLGSNSFAGIKLYPPQYFDPWPEDDAMELEKVVYLYKYCMDKEIPIRKEVNNGRSEEAFRANWNGSCQGSNQRSNEVDY